MKNAYELARFCPLCGTEFEILRSHMDDVDVCPADDQHAAAFNPELNDKGVMVMVLDTSHIKQ
jgi:hypothetical protein